MKMLVKELFVANFIMKIFPTVIYDINEMIYKTTKDHNILQNNLLWREEFCKTEQKRLWN